MTNVRVVSTDSETGCETTTDLQLEELTGECLCKTLAFEMVQEVEDGADDVFVGSLESKAWVANSDGKTFAFIAACSGDTYFGDYLVTGIVYTEFV